MLILGACATMFWSHHFCFNVVLFYLYLLDSIIGCVQYVLFWKSGKEYEARHFRPEGVGARHDSEEQHKTLI